MEDLWTRQSCLRDESRSFWCLTRPQWVWKCFGALVRAREQTRLEISLNKTDGGENNHSPGQKYGGSSRGGRPLRRLCPSVPLRPSCSAPCWSARSLRWQEIKNPSGSSRRRFMSAHANVSVIYRLSQLLRRSLMRSGASGRCATTDFCALIPPPSGLQ